MWTKVEEQMPPDDTTVWVRDEQGRVCEGKYLEGDDLWAFRAPSFGDPVAWAPIEAMEATPDPQPA